MSDVGAGFSRLECRRGRRAGERNADDVRAIAGAFTLLPVAAPWPAVVSGWFGAPGEAAKPLAPFFRSYDR